MSHFDLGGGRASIPGRWWSSRSLNRRSPQRLMAAEGPRSARRPSATTGFGVSWCSASAQDSRSGSVSQRALWRRLAHIFGTVGGHAAPTCICKSLRLAGAAGLSESAADSIAGPGRRLVSRARAGSSAGSGLTPWPAPRFRAVGLHGSPGDPMRASGDERPVLAGENSSHGSQAG